MRNTIKLSDTISIVLSKDEHGFQEVLDDLPNTGVFDVVTFNISSKESALLKTIKQLSPDVRVRVVTNIPNRYEQYYSDKAQEKARDQIRSYLKQLNPTQYVAEMSAFFSYDTHCKLFATENVAYMGSGNFSDESARNFECGVIIRDKAVIKELVDMVFAAVTESADQHKGNAIATTIIQLNAVGARLKSLLADYEDLFYSETDEYASPNFRYFEWQDPRATEADLDALSNLLDELDNILADMQDDGQQEPIARAFSMKQIEKTRAAVLPDEPLHNFITHDSDSFMQSWIEDNGIYVDDGHDGAAEDAANEDFDKRSELADEAKPVVKAMMQSMKGVLSEIEATTGALKKIQISNRHIDNT
ncbi:MAG TPA: phospholipase D-like domain-containing protein [Tepidisphaeraceae bacterium]|nr:phospholipase D-like domain-containing protein [Tepidisphaeraceae bacterium]